MPFDPSTKADGHMYAHDPRHLLWRSHGCPFPTIPPYRWRVFLPSATGEWAPLVGGIFCDPTGPDEHPQVTWEATVPPFYSVSAVQVNKDHRTLLNGDEYSISVFIRTSSGLEIEHQSVWGRRKCNLPVDIPVDTSPFAPGNSPGPLANLVPYQWFAE